MSQLPEPSLIAELEARQDEALQSLDELEQRIAAVIAEFTGQAAPAPLSVMKAA